MDIQLGSYPIDVYKLGIGKKHVLIIGATHGCELITVYFVLELIINLLIDEELYKSIYNDYTFHFIPILNPEGYIISSSNVFNKSNAYNNETLEKLAKIYLTRYNIDDDIASQNIKTSKLFTTVLETSICNLPTFNMQKKVEIILQNCCLNSGFLPVWTANSMGVDINSNSIHKFLEMKKLRISQKCAYLRYNDIPVTKPSPMSFPGSGTFNNCPENLILYNYITKLYNLNNLKSEKLIAIFSYHSTGGEIYGFPDKQYATSNQLVLHEKAMSIYSNITDYTLIDEKLKYGVMDFYRVALENVATLTIELSKLNANPIGPYANLDSLEYEIIKNKEALINTINEICK